jgi:hypothetical protein
LSTDVDAEPAAAVLSELDYAVVEDIVYSFLVAVSLL